MKPKPLALSCPRFCEGLKDCICGETERSQLLKSLVEEVEGMRVNPSKERFYGKGEIEWGFETTYNQALQDVIKLLEKYGDKK